MQIQLNGNTREMPEAATVATLIDQLQLVGRRVAVEINEEIVPRSRHAEHQLKPGDNVEVVHAIGGG
ncbi:sulfur carrier protein ThiS [Marinobacter sp. 1Y8]